MPLSKKMKLNQVSIDLENPVIDVTPSPLTGYTSSSHGSKDVLLCERVQVAGQSRLELGSYAVHIRFLFLYYLGLSLRGSRLGYLMVRKFVIAEDGSVDVGVAQFVKWAMRVIAATFIFQSTLDTPLAMGALASCLSICSLITSFKWNGPDSTITFGNSIYSANGNPWRGRGRANVRQNRAEFLGVEDGGFTGNTVEQPKELFWLV
ncbi:hypothetical protein LOK49_LG12G02189 [Camellia lanceoleosa]|uniref:Uncharacterized protein n=1 Tax=Camellia lanceoleosa TaxID=1840588 RepID=A0ACC0FSS7_9ERIC|nr:hypothetical protein LOK49_LG12G02189 [Camellia lanceoleosa]